MADYLSFSPAWAWTGITYDIEDLDIWVRDPWELGNLSCFLRLGSGFICFIIYHWKRSALECGASLTSQFTLPFPRLGPMSSKSTSCSKLKLTPSRVAGTPLKTKEPCVIYDDDEKDEGWSIVGWAKLSYPNIHEGRRYGGAVNIWPWHHAWCAPPPKIEARAVLSFDQS